MKTKILKTSALTLLFCFFLLPAMAQTSVNATGGNASGSGGSASYSVGQMVSTFNVGTNGSVAHGVQQAFEISVVEGIEETKNINLMVSIYPNPTTDNLTLSVENVQLSSFSFQVFDVQGKLLQNEKIVDRQTSIRMNNHKPAVYFIKVIQDKRDVKTFKIIKK